MVRAAAVLIVGLLLACDVYAVEYAGQKFRDPFGLVNQPQPKQSQTATRKSPLVLQGLVWNAKQPQAVINGKVVQAGSVLNDVKILEVTKEGVRAKYIDQDQEFMLTLK